MRVVKPSQTRNTTAQADKTKMAKKVLLVSTSAGQMGEHPTGLWISELAEPYTVFTKAGFDVTIASNAGGAVPI